MDEIRPLFDAVKVHEKNYSSGGADYSVTTLINTPRIVHLEKRHMHKVTRYVKDQLGSFIGTAIHNYLEECLNKIPDSPYKCEERLTMTVSDRVVSGAYDIVRIDSHEDMYDLKTTSTWKVIFGSKEEWTAQQNMYRYLYWLHHKKKLRTIRIIAIFMDWALREAQRYGGKYPQEKAVEYSLPRWSMDSTLEYITGRVEVMKENEDIADNDLPLCTYEDMWSKPDKWAVKSLKRKNALRVCDSESLANTWMEEHLAMDTCKHKQADLYLECRPNARTRCEHWCPVNKYCNQFQNYILAAAMQEASTPNNKGGK